MCVCVCVMVWCMVVWWYLCGVVCAGVEFVYSGTCVCVYIRLHIHTYVCGSVYIDTYTYIRMCMSHTCV